MEISSKGGLHRVLEVAKVGKIKAHMHIPEDQLQLGETLGTGTFAEVKKGLWQDKVFYYILSFFFLFSFSPFSFSFLYLIVNFIVGCCD